MTKEFPKYSRSAMIGEKGVGIVARLVTNSFGWLFKRNHQEHDFGVDGQIEMIDEDGTVTGKIIAVQIKCGQSFLEERNQWGYIYRGERKHFNYLANYPVPVVIILCDPDSEECYWTFFQPETTAPTKIGWKTTIPFQNKLSTSKKHLSSLVSPVRDAHAELQHFWSVNSLLSSSHIIFYILDPADVANKEVFLPRAFFDRLRTTRELASRCQGKIEIMFTGYDDDPRELHEIPEIRDYVSLLDQALPDLFFFAPREATTYTLITFLFCQVDVETVTSTASKDGFKTLHFDNRQAIEFVTRHCPALNELTEWLNMPLDEEERLFDAVIRRLGLQVPEEKVKD